MRFIKPNARRCGYTLIPVVVLLAIASGLSVGLVQQTRQLDAMGNSSRHRAQSQWLAEAALQRAVVQLQRDPNYQGETWQAAWQNDAGNVQITVVTLADNLGSEVQVEATYPLTSPHPVTVRQSMRMVKEAR